MKRELEGPDRKEAPSHTPPPNQEEETGGGALVCTNIIYGSKGLRLEHVRPPLPWVQILFHFHAVFGKKFGKILGWRPYLGGWYPPVWEILDPPLNITGRLSCLSYFN